MQRLPLDSRAYVLMVALCMAWALQQVAIKVAAVGIPPLLQGGIRSVAATLLLLGWIAMRRIPVFDHDGTLAAGLGAGLLFGVEFVFIYAGLGMTTASRMAVFIYLAPCLTALGLHFFVPGERLKSSQWLGIALAFGGIVTAFGDGFMSNAPGSAATGDAFGVIAAVIWSATTLLIRTTRLSNARAEKTLLYQIGVSAVVLMIASFAFGERGITAITPLIAASMFYQIVVVAFASYLAWFWLLTRYLAARLSVFSFLTPLFGVAFGMLLLGERVSAAFVAAAVMVAIGIALVNRRT